jgi:hypothetical protein
MCVYYMLLGALPVLHGNDVTRRVSANGTATTGNGMNPASVNAHRTNMLNGTTMNIYVPEQYVGSWREHLPAPIPRVMWRMHEVRGKYQTNRED